MNFNQYVEGNTLETSDINIKINVKELVNFLQNKKNIKMLSLINVEIDCGDV
ncbi:hypothetical protein [Wolbachia endosymbiont of Mansonella ozzardi]|uniref:hypothetical protein n=1 Tax=Wolbachia endosymbiont of Mansonella ozzardi TaxID=137464 RepID=UPI001CE0E5F7|nr:hypothetical protein [Wolbachia endosymbiont of Mansonella ozzardi]